MTLDFEKLPGSSSQSAVQKLSTTKTKNEDDDVFTQSRPGSSSPSAVQKPSTSKMKHEYGDVLTQSRPGSSAQSVFGKSSSSKNKENSVNVMRKTLKEYFGNIYISLFIDPLLGHGR